MKTVKEIEAEIQTLEEEYLILEDEAEDRLHEIESLLTVLYEDLLKAKEAE